VILSNIQQKFCRNLNLLFFIINIIEAKLFPFKVSVGLFVFVCFYVAVLGPHTTN